MTTSEGGTRPGRWGEDPDSNREYVTLRPRLKAWHIYVLVAAGVWVISWVTVHL